MVLKISVDENNDWYLNENKNIALVRDLIAIKEECEHVVKTVIGELVFEIERGVLSFEVGGTFGNNPDLLFFDSRARRAWLGVVGVVEVISLDASISDNILSYNATIETIFGEFEISSNAL